MKDKYKVIRCFIVWNDEDDCPASTPLWSERSAQGVKMSSEGVYFMVDISKTQRYKCLGNAFNVDVVAHILSFIPKE